MNNEIGRKITSLTLMAIMVAGGMTFAAPGFLPAAQAANANLFVSAENSQFDNYMSGPQVIEVVVIDSDINDTGDSQGEPDVTVNGKILRMVQATDGNWYGYFTDRAQAEIADATSTVAGEGLNFGVFCDRLVTIDDGFVPSADVTFGDTSGVAFPILAGEEGATDNTVPADGTCAADGIISGDITITPNNVVRESKLPNTNDVGAIGQIGIAEDMWPFIQLYNLSAGGNVNVQYNKAGGAQTVSLTFDTVEGYAVAELDRTIYPQGAEVHYTITDLWLNIDPTDEDSWTFGTTDDVSTIYQVFDENGLAVGDTATNITTATGSLTAELSALMCESNCFLVTNPDVQGTGTNVFTLQDTDDIEIQSIGDESDPLTWETAGSRMTGDIPITVTELGPNSGIFGTYDEGDVSNIIITDDALRGTSAFIDYNETPITILVGFDFASIDIQPIDDVWSSGEEIPVVIIDGDANKNSRADEDLDNFNPAVTIIPALSTGSPFTLEEEDNFFFIDDFNVGTADDGGRIVDITTTQNEFLFDNDDNNANSGDFEVQAFSQRAILNIDNANLIDIDLDSTGETDGTSDRGSVFVITYVGRTLGDLKETVRLPTTTVGIDDIADTDFVGFNYFNYDIRSFNVNILSIADGGDGPVIEEVDIFLIVDPNPITDVTLSDVTLSECIIAIAEDAPLKGLQLLGDIDRDGTADDFLYEGIYDDDSTCTALSDADDIAIMFLLDDLDTGFINLGENQQAITADFFSFGFTDDGVQAGERIADQIIRIEAEESGDNTSTFEGTLKFTMVNQLNISVESTYGTLFPIDNFATFIVIEDLTDEDAPRISYNDLGADGVVTPVSDQEETPSHSGVVSFDSDSYKIADTVIITLEDADLNTDQFLIDIFTVVTALTDVDNDVVGFDAPDELEGFTFGSLGRLLDVTFDDVKWQNNTGCDPDPDNDGLGDTGFTLVETDIASGVFVGDFQIPAEWCRADNATPETTTGLDIEVNYVDYRDASGEIIEVGDSAGVRANTGTVSLDRTVYPVPFGVPVDFGSPANSAPTGDSIFAIHASGFNGDTFATNPTIADVFIPSGDLTIHIRVNDPDSDLNPAGEDNINFARNGEVSAGPVKVSVIRGADTIILTYVGGPSAVENRIFVGADPNDPDNVREFGPMGEIAPDAGIFEADITIRYTDGPASPVCPVTTVYTDIGVGDGIPNGEVDDRFVDDSGNDVTGNFCILQGDILQVEYEDPADASGNLNTVTDSATFDLRNGVLQSDKSVYIIGSDMILTLIEPDFDLDNDGAETYDLDLIEWDSDAATVTMGDRDGEGLTFDP
ncbi:MAG: hypothetical protein IIA83_00155, partial [Thaumarchaeota archaeon]|nr:hypothetical protein [Nitrososphaerota archaeon]